MTANSPLLITTPLFYANAAPHIGHAYSTIAADVVARIRRQQGREALLVTGTDEHGQKLVRTAESRSVAVRSLVDDNAAAFAQCWAALDIGPHTFWRTTSPDHAALVARFWRRLGDSGDLYLDEYAGWYAPSDEAYYGDSEVADGFALASGSPVERIREPAWFFRLSRYAERLRVLLGEPGFLQPSHRVREVIALIERGVPDLCVSRPRASFDWGVLVPDDPDHLVYVWVDALCSYLGGAGATLVDDELGAWPADVHVIGKDILRFHAIIWPALLWSAGLPLPRRLVAHGWWQIADAKISKSRGNVVDPEAVTAQYGADALRWFLAREVPFGADGAWSDERLAVRYDTELRHVIGNLLHRVVGLLLRGDGVVRGTPSDALADAVVQARATIARAADDVAIHEIADAVLTLAREVNGYLQREAPWAITEASSRANVLSTATDGAVEVLRLAAPLIPTAAARGLAALGLGGGPDVLRWARPVSAVGRRVEPSPPLFPPRPPAG